MSIVLRSLKNSIHTQISGKRTSLSSYAFFRKISAAKPGQGVTREGLQLAMLYLKINASEEQMTEAFNTLSHGNGAKGIHYQQFVKSIGNASKAQAKRPDSSRNHSNTNSVRSMFEKDKLNIAGISSSRKGPPTASQRSYLTARTKARTEEAATLNRVIDVEGHRFKVAEILGLVRLKCNGRNPGSAGVRRMWRQFRSLAGARTQGTITKKELAKAFKHYGVPLSSADLTFVFQYADLKKDGKLDYDEWKMQLMGFKTASDDMEESIVKERPKRVLKFAPMELQAGENSPPDIFIMLRAKMAMHQRGAPLAKKTTWKQFRIKSGADNRGIRPENFALAMKYYGMPMTKERSDYVFSIIDTKGDGIIDYDEFVDVVLGRLAQWKPTEGTLEAPIKFDDSINTFRSTLPGSPQVSPSKKETREKAVVENTSLAKTEVPALNLSAKTGNDQLGSNLAVTPLPVDSSETKNAVMMKLSLVALSNWRDLQSAFRKADNKRSGLISKLDFMGILADFNVSLDKSELNFLVSQYGGGKKKVSSSFQRPGTRRPWSSTGFSGTTSRLLRGNGIKYGSLLKDVLLGTTHLSPKSSSGFLRTMTSSGFRNTKSRIGRYMNGKTKVPPLNSQGHGTLQFDPEVTGLL
jgi:Ca2+-binding EF-hand superfamily protein